MITSSRFKIVAITAFIRAGAQFDSFTKKRKRLEKDFQLPTNI